MKKLSFAFLLVFAFASCKEILYTGNYGQINQTQVSISNAQFKTLGSFKGTSTDSKIKLSMGDKEGLISRAKTNLFENAKAAGVELVGARVLTNVCVDMVQTKFKVAVTISGEIIEFLH